MYKTDCVDADLLGVTLHHHYYYTFTGIDKDSGRGFTGGFITTYVGNFDIGQETLRLMEDFESPVIQGWYLITCSQHKSYADMLQKVLADRRTKNKKHLQVVPFKLPSTNTTTKEDDESDKI